MPAGEEKLEFVQEIGLVNAEFSDEGYTKIENFVNKFLRSADPEIIDTLRSRYEDEFNLLLPGAQLKNAMSSMLSGGDILMGTPKNWFAKLEPDEQSALMSIIGGSNFSPDRQAGGVSALASIGRAFGIGAGAIIGGVASGGNPAGIAAGASAGAAATSGLE